MKKILVAALLLLVLAGCGETRADLQHDAKFAKACHAAGGKVWYDGGIRCDFSDGTP